MAGVHHEFVNTSWHDGRFRRRIAPSHTPRSSAFIGRSVANQPQSLFPRITIGSLSCICVPMRHGAAKEDHDRTSDRPRGMDRVGRTRRTCSRTGDCDRRRADLDLTAPHQSATARLSTSQGSAQSLAALQHPMNAASAQALYNRHELGRNLQFGVRAICGSHVPGLDSILLSY